MVDLAEIQTVYYMVAATGVLVAAVFYVLNMRETTRNRKVALTSNLLQAMFSEEGLRRFISLMNMEWSDFEDFEKKYDSKVNEENYAKRTAFVTTVNYIGYLVKEGLIDVGSVYEICGEAIMDVWLKFRPIFLKYVELGGYGKDIFENFEYLAKVMIKMKAARDPNYKGSAPYITPKEYDKVAKG
jgi:hypothetical protein